MWIMTKLESHTWRHVKREQNVFGLALTLTLSPKERGQRLRVCWTILTSLSPPPTVGFPFTNASDSLRDSRRFSLSLGERAGVRASVSKNAVRGCERTAMMREWKMELQRRTEFLARPHPYPLPQGEGTALARLVDNPHVSLAIADCWSSFQERERPFGSTTARTE